MLQQAAGPQQCSRCAAPVTREALAIFLALPCSFGRTPGELAKQRLCAVLGSYRTATKEGTGEGRRGEGKGGKGGKPKQQLCAVLGC